MATTTPRSTRMGSAARSARKARPARKSEDSDYDFSDTELDVASEPDESYQPRAKRSKPRSSGASSGRKKASNGRARGKGKSEAPSSRPNKSPVRKYHSSRGLAGADENEALVRTQVTVEAEAMVSTFFGRAVGGDQHGLRAEHAANKLQGSGVTPKPAVELFPEINGSVEVETESKPSGDGSNVAGAERTPSETMRSTDPSNDHSSSSNTACISTTPLSRVRMNEDQLSTGTKMLTHLGMDQQGKGAKQSLIDDIDPPSKDRATLKSVKRKQKSVKQKQGNSKGPIPWPSFLLRDPTSVVDACREYLALADGPDLFRRLTRFHYARCRVVRDTAKQALRLSQEKGVDLAVTLRDIETEWCESGNPIWDFLYGYTGGKYERPTQIGGLSSNIPNNHPTGGAHSDPIPLEEDPNNHYVEETAFLYHDPLPVTNAFEQGTETLNPLPPPPGRPSIPKDLVGGWTYDDESRVLRGVYTDIQHIPSQDRQFLLEIMERDDVTVITEGLLNMIDPRKYNFKYLVNEMRDSTYHKFRRFARFVDEQGVASYNECNGMVSMKPSEYVRYLERRNKARGGELPDQKMVYSEGTRSQEENEEDVVLYMIDVEMSTYLKGLDDDFKRGFKVPDVLPAGSSCLLNNVSEFLCLYFSWSSYSLFLSPYRP